MIPNVFDIAQEIQADLGITSYDQLNIWRLKYYENNLVTPITRSQPLPHAQFVFDQINAANSIQLSPYDFSISTPIAYSNPQYPNVNTEVTLTPADLTGYSGTPTIYYSRIDISDVLKTQSVSVTPNSAAINLSDIIAQINTAYNLDLQTGDYVDVVLPVTKVGQTTPAPVAVTISIVPSCLKYTGTYNFLLNYQSNSSTLAVGTTNPNSRAVLVFNAPAATPVNTVVESFTLLGQQDTSFSLGINATNITQFTITSSFYESTQSLLYLNGTFNLTFTNNSIQTTGQFSTLVVNAQGLITQGLTTPLFQLSAGFNWAVNRLPGYYFAINPSEVVSAQSLNRYLPTGLIDTTYTTNLPYTPVSAFIQASGNVYVVSAPFNAVNPYNAQGIAQNLVRIDRLLSTGLLDSTFNTVFLSPSIVNNPVCTVIDILETPTDLIQILVNELTGYGVNSNVPVVNTKPIVAINASAGSQVTWVPIISLLMSGAINPSFNNTLNAYSAAAICADPTKTNQVGLNLNFYSGLTSYWTYIQNPVTGLTGYIPLQFDSFGNPQYYGSTQYQNMPVYATLQIAGAYSDGTYVVTGTLSSVNMNGVMSAQKDLASVITPDGQSLLLAPMQTGVFPSGTVSIEAVYSF